MQGRCVWQVWWAGGEGLMMGWTAVCVCVCVCVGCVCVCVWVCVCVCVDVGVCVTHTHTHTHTHTQTQTSCSGVFRRAGFCLSHRATDTGNIFRLVTRPRV